MPAAVVFATFKVAEAVPPVPAAGVKPSRVIPATGALVILAPVTVPSGSVALTPADVAVPCVVVNDAGQVGVIGWFGGLTVTDTMQSAVCGVGESLFDHRIVTL